MKLLLLAAAGGAIGASARYLVSAAALRWFGYGFPWGTFTVNILGCFLMGVLVELLALKYSASNEARTFLATGILGGFTTFSAFSLDFALLYERGEIATAMTYAIASVLLSILALFAGLSLIRSVLT